MPHPLAGLVESLLRYVEPHRPLVDAVSCCRACGPFRTRYRRRACLKPSRLPMGGGGDRSVVGARNNGRLTGGARMGLDDGRAQREGEPARARSRRAGLRSLVGALVARGMCSFGSAAAQPLAALSLCQLREVLLGAPGRVVITAAHVRDDAILDEAADTKHVGSHGAVEDPPHAGCADGFTPEFPVDR